MLRDQTTSLSSASCQSYECQWLLRNAVSFHVPARLCTTLDSCASEIQSVLASHHQSHTILTHQNDGEVSDNQSKAGNSLPILTAGTQDKTASDSLSEGVLELEINHIWTPVSTRSAMNKTVWLLWLQGWDKAPWMVKQVALSWELHNPAWTVVRLDENNLNLYITVPLRKDLPAPARSDLVRLALMAQQGGVWADGTMLCMQSLDSWVPTALGPAGFWMFHGWGGGIAMCGGAASWFMVSERGSLIATRWLARSLAYWEGRAQTDNYFW